ncbi:hypothetical protein GF369_03165 [Candidatus Peregrinibacteria bacterium]|nr:hypothetical protein [Candidatus Peregrinibacteria bacterium]
MDPTLLKQERQKMHMATDNIRQMIQVIRDRDEKHFVWAWQQLERNVDAIRDCFVGETKEQRKKINDLFDRHAQLFSLQEKLTEKLFKRLTLKDLSDKDIETFTKRFIAFIQDVSISFDLAEFEE